MEDRWVHWIEAKEYRERLIKAESFLKGLSEQSLDISYYTPHEIGHCLSVEKMIKALINKGQVRLKDLEYFILFAAAWTHDLGMFQTVSDAFFAFNKVPNGKRSPQLIRSIHDEISAWYLFENTKSIIGIASDDEIEPKTINQAILREYTFLINIISHFHRIERNIEECPEESFIKGERIRTRLLSSLLRLGDTLHVDTSRFDRNLYDVLQIGEMDRSARLHWLKSYVVTDVYLEPETETIHVSINLPDTRTALSNERLDWEESSSSFKRIIIHDIQEDLLMLRETFRRNAMPAYCQVKANITYVPGYPKEDIGEIKGVIDDLGVIFSPNTSKAIEKALDSINSICIKNFDRADIARSQIRQLIRYLTHVLESRPCHVGLSKVVKEFETVFKQQFPDDEDNLRAVTVEEIMRRQDAIAARITALKEEREENLRKLYSKCEMDIFAGISNIIVFGYSAMVANFLEGYGMHHPTWKSQANIFVLECSAKRRFTSDNDIEYNDGIQYSIEIAKKNFNKVMLLPDTSFASMAYNLRKKNEHKKSLVLFGVNGINEKDYACGHTSGHLMVAIVAEKFQIPVKVIADSFKIGKVKWNTERARPTQWLTGLRTMHEILNNHNIEATNYLEDKIPLDLITEIILEDKNILGKRQS